MFNLAIDSKLRGSNLVHEWPLCARSGLPDLLTLARTKHWLSKPHSPYFWPITMDCPATSGSTRVPLNPASRIQSEHSDPQ
jgi:hypothetical protein